MTAGTRVRVASPWQTSNAAIAQQGPRLERCRARILRRLDTAPFSQVLQEQFARGKMLRPLLVFLAGAAVGGRAEDLEAGGEAIELLHGASLVHDDIIDRAEQRRGISSCHAEVGPEAALVTGDYLLLLALAALTDPRPNVPGERLLAAFESINRCARECCCGQLDELASPETASVASYLRIARRKTGSQFAGAAELGAILGGGTPRAIAALRRFGLAVGVAFQIQDDLLDVVGEANALGKPNGNSIANRRPLLPLIFLRQDGVDPPLGGRGPTQAGLDRVTSLLAESGVLGRIEQVQRRFLAAGERALDALPPSAALEGLRAYARYVLAPSHVSSRLRPPDHRQAWRRLGPMCGSRPGTRARTHRPPIVCVSRSVVPQRRLAVLTLGWNRKYGRHRYADTSY